MATKSKLISILKGEVGYHEGRNASGWDNHQKYSPAVPGLEWSQDQPWCATFATWAYQTAGVKKDTFPVTASVYTAMNWYKQHNRWSEYPSIGAQVIYGRDKHTGIVIAFDADTITTVEGNTNDNGSAEGDGVYIKHRQRRDAYVTGYGSPDFDPEPVGDNSAHIPPAKPVAAAPVFPGRQYFVKGAKNKYALQLQQWLAKIDSKIPGTVGPAYRVGPSDTMTQKDLDKVAALQSHYAKYLGPADGLTGPLTWRYAWELANGKRSW